MGLIEACNIRFHPNYYVHEQQRVYYPATHVPEFVQIEDHAFISSELSELFTSCVLFAWVSAHNFATIFNSTLSHRGRSTESIPALTINAEQVWRAFFYHALLREHHERNINLVLLDIGDNDTRLKLALEARNAWYIRHGQPERMHACKVCEPCFPPGPGYNSLREFTTRIM